MRRASVRRQLEAVAWGRTSQTSVTLEEPRVDVAGVIEQITSGLPVDSASQRRLVAVLMNSGAVDGQIERLEAIGISQRIAAVRAIGALRLYDAVWRVAPLLAARERPVADAAARALGRIGGVQSAMALLLAIHRRGVNRRLVAELARAAPDLFVENALSEGSKPGARPALALAAGLRRRRTASAHLLVLVRRGSRRERVISCRALGWIGDATSIPVITEALADPDWKLRMSAAKALGALRARSARQELRYLYADRNSRVREAARLALRRIEGNGA
jgi:HEAT repeat protein